MRGPSEAVALPPCCGRGLRREVLSSEVLGVWAGGAVLGPRSFPGAAADPGTARRVHPGLSQALASAQVSGCPAVQRAEDAQAGAGLSLTMVLVYRSYCKLQAPLRTGGAAGCSGFSCRR